MFNLVRSIYAAGLTPIPPFTWFGLTISTLDVAATFRLVVILRQLREMFAEVDAHESSLKSASSERKAWEDPSFTKDLAVVLTVVYGGEAIASAFLGFQPSFMISPVFPALYAGVHALISLVPSVGPMSLYTELPASILDGFTRAYLLCQLIPPAIVYNSNPSVANSPWTLLISSMIVANGGFFIVNLFSMLKPTGWSLATPTELQAYGWTTVDLWCAPLTTGLYAFWTHAQPWWGELHAIMLGFTEIDEKVLRLTAVDSETAMARCAVILAALFATRTWKNFGSPPVSTQSDKSIDEKKNQ